MSPYRANAAMTLNNGQGNSSAALASMVLGSNGDPLTCASNMKGTERGINGACMYDEVQERTRNTQNLLFAPYKHQDEERDGETRLSEYYAHFL